MTAEPVARSVAHSVTGTVVGALSEDEIAARNHDHAHKRLVTRPVALVGFMGVGKTSVGRELAALLDRRFVDTDALVVQRAGASVPELFGRGEHVFRRHEHAAVQEALATGSCVIALGGGAFSQPASAGLLLERALVVHLYTPWSELVPMLPELARDRPLLRGRAPWQVEDLFLRRAADYRRAHLRVSLPRTGPREAARVVAAVLRRPEPPSGDAAT